MPCPGARCDEGQDVCIQVPAGLWISFSAATDVAGLGVVENEDIVAYNLDMLSWQWVFDGSDVGLGGFAIDGMAVLPDGAILMSFTASGGISGMSGGPGGGTTLDDSDIVRFVPSSLGMDTAGSFHFYFDGSDVGLTKSNEDIDALALDADGSLLISTNGSAVVEGTSGADTDLLRFTATNLGAATSGSFSVYFDGSDVGLTDASSEDVDGAGLLPDGRILLSTTGAFSVPGVSGANEDVFAFTPTQLGSVTLGSSAMLLDLSTLGIDPAANVADLEMVPELNDPAPFMDIQFSLTPSDGPAPVMVQCTAFRPDGLPLPNGLYTWIFDGIEELGPVNTHGTVSREFLSSGAHVVTLSFALEGTTTPVACPNARTGVYEGFVFVWPAIAGRVATEGGDALAGVILSASNGSGTATTGVDGSYELYIPFGWSGFIEAQHDLYAFAPTQRDYLSVRSSIPEQNFTSILISVPNPVLSGYLRNEQGNPVFQVPLILTGADGFEGIDFQTATDTNGYYRLTVPLGWTGTLRTDANHRIEPPEESDLVVAEDRIRDYIVYRNYYVAADGADIPEDGTYEQPLKTIQAAATHARPGDTIFVRQGTYDLRTDSAYDQGVIYFASSGAPGQPISIQAYPGEAVTLTTAESKPVFDFADTWGHNTAGFGHYGFRNLRIVGGRYGWIFRPPVPLGWQPGVDPVSDLWVSQIHDVIIEDCEVDGSGVVEAGIYIRYGGIRNLTVRRCNFHHTIGTEGTVDIGEWSDIQDGHLVPRSASHNLLFEDCDFHHAVHQQANGIVTQPCTFNVTFRRCRAYNNGKYGFACKGSGNFRLDGCAAWGNDSSQMYCRGFGGDDATPRPYDWNEFLITNCVFIAPADQRGGSALNWRENSHLQVYQTTIVGLRDAIYGQAGGYSFLLGNQHNVPSAAVLRNCVVCGYTGSPAVRFYVANGLPYLTNTRYEGRTNLYYAEPTTKFKYQSRNWQSLSQWQAYWAVGEPNGDDALNGPSATQADATSIFGDPLFVSLNPALAPLRKLWADDLLDPANHSDVRIMAGSPALGLGENLTDLGIPELLFDYEGQPRPAVGPWTVGAFQNPVAP
jgi:hypothetical protein